MTTVSGNDTSIHQNGFPEQKCTSDQPPSYEECLSHPVVGIQQPPQNQYGIDNSTFNSEFEYNSIFSDHATNPNFINHANNIYPPVMPPAPGIASVYGGQGQSGTTIPPPPPGYNSTVHQTDPSRTRIRKTNIIVSAIVCLCFIVVFIITVSIMKFSY